MATLKELMAQRQAIDRQIEQTKKQDRSGAIAKVRALMDEYGLSVDDLGKKAAAKRKTGKGTGKSTGKVAPKFRNTSTGETWSGRGLQPRWLKAALASGKKIGDFAI